jgi:methyl-accepting chemotaxis protein
MARQKRARVARGFGVGTKLYAAFGATALTTVAAAAVALVSFQSIHGGIAEISSKSVPALEASLALAARAADLAAAAPRLQAARTREESAAAAADTERMLGEIRASIDSLSTLTPDKAALATLGTATTDLATRLQGLQSVVEKRQDLAAGQAAAAAGIAESHAALLALLRPAVEHASSEVVSAAEAVAKQNGEAISTLLDKQVGAVRAALEMKAESSLLFGILIEAANVTDANLLAPMRDRFKATADRMQEDVAALADRPEAADAQKLAELVTSFGLSEANLFEIRKHELQAGLIDTDLLALRDRRLGALAEMTKANEQLARAMTQMADDTAFDLTIGAEDAISTGSTTIRELIDNNVGALRLMLELEADSNLMAGIVAAAANETDSERLATLLERFKEASDRIGAQIAKLKDTALQGQLGPVATRMRELATAETGVFPLRAAEIAASQQAQGAIDQVRAGSGEVATDVSAVVASTKQAVAHSSGEAGRSLDWSLKIMAALAAASIVASVLIGWLYVGRRVVRRLQLLTGAMRSISEGNLETAIPASGVDEVATMASALSVFRDNAVSLRAERARADAARAEAEAEKRAAIVQLADTFDSDVSGVLGTVSAATQSLDATARSMSTTANESSARADAVAASLGQASINVQAVASASEELSAAIREIGTQMLRSQQIARRAVDEADRTNATVGSLVEAATKIGEIVELIGTIASQTSLLALNATIEASRAGEAGRGFAVVASEVKALASQTAGAAKDITAQIQSIQSVSNQAAGAIHEIGGTIREIDEIATSIAAAVEEQGAATAEIARNVQQAATGTSEVSLSITGVTDAATQTEAAADSVLASSKGLAEQSEILRTKVDRFLEVMRAA